MRPARAAEQPRNGHQRAAILFDFGGTLDGTLPWKERMFRLCRAEGVEVTPERFDPVFYGADDALVGAIPDARSLAETVRRLAAGLGAALDLSDALDELVAQIQRGASWTTRPAVCGRTYRSCPSSRAIIGWASSRTSTATSPASARISVFARCSV